jgi:hypothetical protein
VRVCVCVCERVCELVCARINGLSPDLARLDSHGYMGHSASYFISYFILCFHCKIFKSAVEHGALVTS